jgi:hypothetical protein
MGLRSLSTVTEEIDVEVRSWGSIGSGRWKNRVSGGGGRKNEKMGNLPYSARWVLLEYI